MSGTWAICRRELMGLFASPLAWILLVVALSFNGAWFWLYLTANQGEVNASIDFLLGRAWPYWALMATLPPLITMRMISEESRTGLLEFLLTAPVTESAVVSGKALAATLLMGVVWSSALVYGLAAAGLGVQVDWGQLIGALGGALLVSALFCSVGLVASALSSTPLIAALLAFVFNLFLLVASAFGGLVDGLPRENVERVVDKINVLSHLQGSFMRGLFDSAHLVFFLVWIGFFLFLAVRLLEARRWR